MPPIHPYFYPLSSTNINISVVLTSQISMKFCCLIAVETDS
jgi:hypothetical protein